MFSMFLCSNEGGQMMAGCAPSVTSIARILPVIVRPKLELKFKYFIRLWKFFWASSRVYV